MFRTFLFLFVGIFFSTTIVFAGGFSDEWAYSFHLQSVNNVITPDNSTGETYTPIPELYVPTVDPKKSAYYGVIKNIKGKETARFGFDEPQTTVSLLGKSMFDVKAPFFADSDHVEFYSKNGTRLFDISVKGSSFCDDNGACNDGVGETYLNCPFDCPPPPEEPATPPSNTTTPPSKIPDITSPNTDIPVSVVNPTTTQTGVKNQFSLRTTTLLVLGVIFLILVFILWKLRGFRDEA